MSAIRYDPIRFGEKHGFTICELTLKSKGGGMLDLLHDEGGLHIPNILESSQFVDDKTLVILHVFYDDLKEVIVHTGDVVALNYLL